MANSSTMNGKPVFEVPAKSVINFTSGFSHKLLCDGLTFTAGSACAFSCTFCYVPDLMRKSPHMQNVEQQHGSSIKHHEVVIRRSGAIEAIERQLTNRRRVGGRVAVTPKFKDPNDTRVLYMSPLVDIAANQELANETVEACKMILDLTNWQIRLLSKSVMIRSIAEQLHFAKDRLIFGLSTGTLDDNLTASFEQGTSRVSGRLKTLHWLQDNGFRTYGMICPSLPQKNYATFADEMYQALRGDRCEHVWAECMNARGESFTRTYEAIKAAGYTAEAEAFRQVTASPDEWELYSRQTFLAHAQLYKPGQLRFLQYVNKDSKPWWKERENIGAILL